MWPWAKQPKPVPVAELTPSTSDRAPDWEKIVNSEVWKEELYPMYYALRQAVLEEFLKAKTPDEFRFLQGKALAFDAITRKPAEMAGLEQFRKQQEARFEENEDGTGRDRGIVERFGRPTRTA